MFATTWHMVTRTSLLYALVPDGEQSMEWKDWSCVPFTERYRLPSGSAVYAIADANNFLCKSKERSIVEYALQGSNQPIGVSSYLLQSTLPAELEKSLPSPQQLEMGLNTALAEMEGQNQDISHS